MFYRDWPAMMVNSGSAGTNKIIGIWRSVDVSGVHNLKVMTSFTF